MRDGDILTGSQVVRVYGENLTAPFVTLTFGDVEYTPLYQGEGYIDFIMNDNGAATINVDGSRFMSFEIEGTVVPDGFPTQIYGRQKNDVSAYMNVGDMVNQMILRSANCMNYPYVFDDSYPYFNFAYMGTLGDNSDFDFVNCTLNQSVQTDSYRGLNVSVVDATKVAYITYQGFIIAVFNYTAE